MSINEVSSKALELFRQLNAKNPKDNVVNADDMTELNKNILKALGVVDENGNSTGVTYTAESIEQNYETISQKIAALKQTKTDIGIEAYGKNEKDTDPMKPKKPDGTETAKDNDSDNYEKDTDPMKPKKPDGTETAKDNDSDNYEKDTDPMKPKRPNETEEVSRKRQPGKQVVKNGKRVILMPSGDIYDLSGRKIGHENP